MSRFIAFLRAINVGGHTVKMDVLRGLFETLDLRLVETFIASGNVIFETPAAAKSAALERKLEAHLEGALGYPVATFLRTPAALTGIAGYPAFDAAQRTAAKGMYVGFLGAAPTPAASAKLMALKSESDNLHLHDREVYWLAHTGFHESKLSGGLMERTLGMPVTFRNISTVIKLADKYGGK